MICSICKEGSFYDMETCFVCFELVCIDCVANTQNMMLLHPVWCMTCYYKSKSKPKSKRA